MTNYDSFPEPQVGIPEDSDSFRKWQAWHDAGEPERPSTDSTIVEIDTSNLVSIPENSPGFQEYLREHGLDSVDPSAS